MFCARLSRTPAYVFVSLLDPSVLRYDTLRQCLSGLTAKVESVTSRFACDTKKGSAQILDNRA
jgi:hypothetical protein